MTTITQSTSGATPGQIKQINRFGSDAIEKVLAELGLDNPGAQRVIEHGDEFAEAMRNAALTSLRDLSVSDKYKDEQVDSKYDYPPEYTGPKPIGAQIAAVALMFGLDPTAALTFVETLPNELPAGAEGWFAIPLVEAVARVHFADIEDPAERYCAAVRLVHEKVKATRAFYNYREGEITPDHLRRHARTSAALQTLCENQSGDILIVAAQLGRRHKGRSTRRAREVFTTGEFGLGSFEVGVVVLTHPERLIRWQELDMDAPGDEFAPGAEGAFSGAPRWSFDGGKVKFDSDGVDGPYERFGSASGFVPQ